MFEDELMDCVIRFVVIVLPKIVRVFAAVRLAYIFVPIAKVSVGNKFDIPEVFVPVVRKPSTFTLPLIVATSLLVGSITTILLPIVTFEPTFIFSVNVFPNTSKTLEPVSSTKRLEPTQRSWVGKILATPTAFEV